MMVKAATTDVLSSDGEVRLKVGEMVLVNGRRLIAGNPIGGVRTFTDANDPRQEVSYTQSAINMMTKDRRLLIEGRCHDLPDHVREALTRALKSYTMPPTTT